MAWMEDNLEGKWYAEAIIEEMDRMDSVPTLWILCGNYSEFKYHEKELKHDFHVRYLTKPEQIAGRRFGSFICVGTWFSRLNIIQILTALKTADFYEITGNYTPSGFRILNQEWEWIEYKDDFITEEEMKI